MTSHDYFYVRGDFTDYQEECLVHSNKTDASAMWSLFSTLQSLPHKRYYDDNIQTSYIL